MTTRIVINTRYGGFSMSKEAIAMYQKLAGKEVKLSTVFYTRNDPVLVQVVETLGKRANGAYSDLKIVDVPDDVEWEIQEYDGKEWIAEKHRTWG
jgi:hypothetical protein